MAAFLLEYDVLGFSLLFLSVGVAIYAGWTRAGAAGLGVAFVAICWRFVGTSRWSMETRYTHAGIQIESARRTRRRGRSRSVLRPPGSVVFGGLTHLGGAAARRFRHRDATESCVLTTSVVTRHSSRQRGHHSTVPSSPFARAKSSETGLPQSAHVGIRFGTTRPFCVSETLSAASEFVSPSTPTSRYRIPRPSPAAHVGTTFVTPTLSASSHTTNTP